ncbi:hypothetical protein Acr_19g0003480 [Actinidia rufa]|uniref:Uncharacterized protein n=1 Tax=Actinidia rufa TaxID=165716 RepID=A0A7J0G9I2_9ERIC|nr:hypothetical protein Acr_19g0003480 [Actinidia rufa]
MLNNEESLSDWEDDRTMNSPLRVMRRTKEEHVSLRAQVRQHDEESSQQVEGSYNFSIHHEEGFSSFTGSQRRFKVGRTLKHWHNCWEVEETSSKLKSATIANRQKFPPCGIE